MLRQLIICGFVLLGAEQLSGQSIEVISFDKLEELLNKEVDKVRIINFWATFCAPCIKEMPQFEEARTKFLDSGVEIYLVSVDFVEDIRKVKKFVSKKGIKNTVLLLDEIDHNSWIDKVDNRWSGAIPTTLFIDNKEQVIIERQLEKGELNEIVKRYINL